MHPSGRRIHVDKKPIQTVHISKMTVDDVEFKSRVVHNFYNNHYGFSGNGCEEYGERERERERVLHFTLSITQEAEPQKIS